MRSIITGALCTFCVALAACYNTQTLAGDTSMDAPDTRDSGPEVGPDTAIDPPRPDGPVPDAVDVPPDEDPWPCTPEFAAHQRNILGGLSVNVGGEDDPDHPDLFTLDSDQVWLVSRVVDSPDTTDTPKLVYVMVNPRNANPNSAYYSPVSHVDIDPLHPTVPYGDSFVTVHQDRGDWSINEILYRIMDMPPSSGSLGAFSDTDFLSSQPAAASSGTGLCAAWRQESDSGEPARIEFGIVNEAGEVSARGNLSALVPDEDPSHPLVVFNGSGYGILFLAVPGLFSTLWLAQIHEDGTVSHPPLPIPSEVITGGAAATWNGSKYAILSEGSSSLQFSLHSPSGGGSGRYIEDSIVPTTGPIVEPVGMLDMVWTGYRYGVVWTHLNPATGSHVWFFELSRDGDLLNGPYALNPEATQSANPAITWIETPSLRYYVFAWDEFSSTYGWHVLFTYSYGCTM